MSNGQLRERLKEVEQDLKDVTLERLNVSRALARLRVHQDTWKHILDLVGTQDVPALHRIFKNSKRRNWSAEHLLEKIKMALAGDYHARSYSDLEIELATVVYELGGDAALHALHNSPFVFPCRNTLLEHRREFRLHITVGAITMSDILANIGIMFADVKPGHSRAGITLSMDEIASDGRLCYLTITDEIAGLCEHAATELSSLKMGTNLDVVRAVRQALQEGKIHVGQEVFVAAFARNDEEGYGARPVLLIPTCKRGSFRDSALVMEMLRQAWKISPYGESLHGPIWSIASDGDPKRRPALYLHCMTRELRPTDPLFQHLENLPGMNVWTGPNGETQDLDYKHCFKRLCKLLCAREGILIGDVIINKSLLALWFERLTDVDWSKNSIYSLLNSDSSISERIHALLSPKDAQDVPRAIKLLNITADIRNLDNSAFDPSEQNTHRALSLLGEMLEALLEPFINPDFAISQQITGLIKFAHIACALFLKHEGDFMPQHLYSDLQCMVRTAVFRVAHTKILDPQRKVFICLLGDDVLEVLFGRVRMIGGHSPNVDISELRNRFGSAIRLDSAFERHPDWERRPYRLKLQRSRDADHLTPRQWRGELRACTCDLLACWSEGVRQAEAALSKFGYTINFSEHFRDWRAIGIDLMRPKGGKYPGISSEVDRSLGEAEEMHDEIEPEAEYTFRSFDGEAAREAEVQRSQSDGPDQPHSIWMELEGGKPGHKKTILRLFMDPSLDVDYNKSHDRLLRVRYFSIGGDHWDRSKATHVYSGSPLSGRQLFSIGSLYATLVCIDQNRICVAVLQCTLLKSASQYLDSVPVDEISLPDSKYDVSGQILSLIPAMICSSQGISMSSWVWTSRFVALNTAKSRTTHSTSITRLNHLSIPVNGRIVYPLLPEQCRSTRREALQLAPDLVPSTMEKTWVITETYMRDIESLLHERVSSDSDALSKIPLFGSVREGSFPYRAVLNGPDRTTTAIDHYTTSIAAPCAANAPKACNVCHRQVSGPDRQNHMGGHLLRKIRGVIETGENLGTLSIDYPCGFCGQSSVNGACQLRIVSGKAVSSCPQVYEFRISAASKISKQKPCTNVPVVCKFCTEVHWKYNIRRHLQERHPSWEKGTASPEIADFSEKISISSEEETKLGIPEEFQGRSALVIDTYDARRSHTLPHIHDHHGDSPRRPRYISPAQYTSMRPTPPPFSLSISAPSLSAGVYQNYDDVFH